MKYPHPTPDSDMAKEPAAMPQITISPVDALWALYQSQPKTVRKVFRRRVLEEDVSINGTTSTSSQEQLSPEERKSVSLLAYSIKKAVNEVRSATSNHTHVGRLADDFLSELEHDEA